MVTARALIMLAAASVLAGTDIARAEATSPPAQPTPASPAAAEQGAAPAAPAEPTGKDKAEEQPGSDTPAVVVDDNKVESLLGKDVTSAKGEKLGQITDILVSHSGEIRAAVIDFGGFLGVGSRKIAVAWKTLKFSPNAITLGMTRDELRVTPEYHQGEPIVIVGAAAQSSPPATPQPQPQPQPTGSPPSPAPGK